MEKEILLQKAQKENNGRDVADLEAQRRGSYIAYFVALALILAVDVVDGIVLHKNNYGANMALLAMAFAAFVTKFALLKKKHELFVALAYGVGATVFAVLWILQLCGVVQ